MRLLTLDVIISNEIKYMIDHQPILEGEASWWANLQHF